MNIERNTDSEPGRRNHVEVASRHVQTYRKITVILQTADRSSGIIADG